MMDDGIGHNECDTYGLCVKCKCCKCGEYAFGGNPL